MQISSGPIGYSIFIIIKETDIEKYSFDIKINIKINALTVTWLLSFTDDVDHTAEFPRRRTMAEPTLPILPECPSGENSSVSRMDVSIHSGRDVDAETLQVMTEPTPPAPPCSDHHNPSRTNSPDPPWVPLRGELFCIKNGCQHPQWQGCRCRDTPGKDWTNPSPSSPAYSANSLWVPLKG